jgi:anion-transporting  ArsA/GET3 family ATPase
VLHIFFKKLQVKDWSVNLKLQVDEIKELFAEMSRTVPMFSEALQSESVKYVNQIEDLKIEAEELKNHLNNETEHSIALCAARAASQRLAEREALRKFHCLEATYQRLKNNNLLLSEQAINIQTKFANKVKEFQLREVNSLKRLSENERKGTFSNAQIFIF